MWGEGGNDIEKLNKKQGRRQEKLPKVDQDNNKREADKGKNLNRTIKSRMGARKTRRRPIT